jgi:hypothetical protein
MKWISVKDRLPGFEGKVFIAYRYRGINLGVYPLDVCLTNSLNLGHSINSCGESYHTYGAYSFRRLAHWGS